MHPSTPSTLWSVKYPPVAILTWNYFSPLNQAPKIQRSTDEGLSYIFFIPLTFGGKIRTVNDAVKRIRAGADKITLNTLLFKDKDEVKKIVKNLGTQAVVASVDYKLIDKKPIVFSNFGRENSNIFLLDFLKKLEDLGVGEIFLQND